MNKSLFLTILAGVIIFIAGCSGNASSDETSGSNSSEEVSGNVKDKIYEINFNTQTPSTHTYNKNAIEPWAELVEEKTNGTVKINIFESGALGGNSTAYQDLQSGVYDLGYIVSSSIRDTELFPLTIADLPFAFNDNITLSKVMNRFKDEYLGDSFPEQLTFGSIGATDPYHIMSREPVEVADDLKGMNIRIAGDDSIKLGTRLGATPVTIELSEMYQAFDRGILDGAAYTGVGSVGMSIYEVAPYFTNLKMSNFQLIYVMNSDTFNKLPEDVQEQFREELFPKLSEMVMQSYNDAEEEALKAYEENGGTIITPGEEEMKTFTEPVEGIWNEWVETANDKGFPGDEMMEYFKELIVEEGGTLPF